MQFNLIVAYSYHKYGIGCDNKLCWHIPNDLSVFKQLTTSTNHKEILSAESNYYKDNQYNPTQTNSSEDDKIYYINTCIMGRKTWDSIPEKFKPLKDRLNIVVTNSNINSTKDNLIFCSWKEVEYKIRDFNSKQYKLNNKIIQTYHNFIIGGQTIYELALQDYIKNIQNIYVTEVYKDDKSDKDGKQSYDRFFPDLNKNEQFGLVSCSKFYNHNNIHYRFMIYRNIIEKQIDKVDLSRLINPEESNYLKTMNTILETGVERCDRTGVGTISKFGEQLKFDLRDTFPLSTTKRMFFRAIFEELMLYLRGQTDNTILTDKNIHIWDGNTSREFLDKRGLKDLPEGDMGSTYGFNFRHFGGKYVDCKTSSESALGYDQLTEAIRLIREDPTSRRIIINLWNPITNQRAALPSCLCMYQFYVDTEHNELSLQIYIRSSDYFLANNWNTCTGALLVHMICGLDGINLTPGELTVVIGDAHIYKTHVSQVRENIGRSTYPFPKLLIEPKHNVSVQPSNEWTIVKGSSGDKQVVRRNYVDDEFNKGKIVNGKRTNLTDYQFEDLKLIGYRAHPRIPAEMAV